ncbi:hypothetical protein GCM10010156_14070 [Planobispora rosea]|uniref:Uncharacterized protein n=1 Tax=Planobispora rosea TaxID=35762 RepID=A0A8J3WD37_PLARO|nr:hypothetical protein [Planobispora rosea]GGS56664.1 hypothetical protein GCM10010156_14070 [Planobispora rosea]GIH83521.1 hypothetical protein Pro02_19290 [Planobispora rosea]
MRLFRRRRDRRAETPPRRIEDVDLDSLLGLVADSLGYGCSFAPDGGTLTLSGPREITVRLTGLRAEAGRRSREDWPMLVSEHLAHTLATLDEPLDACDLSQVRPLLRTRIQPDDDLASARVVGRHLTADLVEVLTVGYGTGGRPVRPEEVRCWPVTAAQALDLALDNARQDERLTVTEEDLGGVPVRRLTGPTACATAHLRRLDDYLSVPADGVLVVLPDPATLVVHPIEGIGVVRAIERLRLLALQEFERGDDPLSPYVYWWHGGRLTLIRADLVSQEGQTRLVVAPPPEFARVLAALAARPDSGTTGD